jgi:site-specific DNA recombinase
VRCAAGRLDQATQGRPAQALPALSPEQGGRACVGVVLPETEDYVVTALFDELDKPEFLDLIAADDHADRRGALTDALRDSERQRDELAALWAIPGELSTAEWQTARRALAEHEQLIRADLAAVPPPLVNVDIATARSAWKNMTLDEKRTFLRLFIAAVTIRRAVPGTRGFDPGRVAIEWRQP